MTADSEMPERHEIEVTRISPGTRTTESYIDDRYVEWIESRLARTEAALKVARKALTYYSEYFGGPLVYSKATLALAQIAALEGKRE